MIHVIACGFYDFQSQIRNRKIFCFGSGRQFHDFINKYPELTICGIIDNYWMGKNDSIEVNGNEYHIMSLECFLRKYQLNSVLVITVKNYGEIVDLLDEYPQLDGTDCYLSLSLLDDDIDSLQHNEAKAYAQEHNLSQYEDNFFKSRNMFEAVKRFQIWDCVGLWTNAGSKAPHDIMKIAGEVGYQRIDIHPWQGPEEAQAIPWTVERNKSDWKRCFDIIPDESILLLQHPFWQPQEDREKTLRALKKERHVKIISFIHDVEELRIAYYTDAMKHEFHVMLDMADAFIVHNRIMKNYFISKGIEPSKIMELGVFDYISNAEPSMRAFDTSVLIAGNLDPSKGKFIERLDEISGVEFHLFGSGYKASTRPSNISYYGAFHMDKILSVLQGGFGLVWNGDSMETCGGNMGNYLRYNSPHKLSLYIAAGLPIIIWKEAAAAEFVRKYDIGISISSLYEIPQIIRNITEIQYNFWLENAKELSDSVRKGKFTKKAIDAAESYILKSVNNSIGMA